MIASPKEWYAPIHIRPILDKNNGHIGYEHIKGAIHNQTKFGNGNWKYDLFKKTNIMDAFIDKETETRIYFEETNINSPYDRFIIGSKQSMLLGEDGPEITKEICKEFRNRFPETPLFANGEKYPYGSSSGASYTLKPRGEKETHFFMKLMGIVLNKVTPIPP